MPLGALVVRCTYNLQFLISISQFIKLSLISITVLVKFQFNFYNIFPRRATLNFYTKNFSLDVQHFEDIISLHFSDNWFKVTSEPCLFKHCRLKTFVTLWGLCLCFLDIFFIILVYFNVTAAYHWASSVLFVL